MRSSSLGAALAGAAAVAGTAFLGSRGRVHIDLGWGRSIHPLGPQTVRIDAPREMVFESISGPYLGRMPSALKDKLTILDHSGDLVVAAHRTGLPIMDAVTVESVTFTAPSRVEFRLLRGPVPHVKEEFVLEETGGQTVLTYRGELGADLWWIGRIWGGRIVRPVWESTVAASLVQIKKTSETRAAAHDRRSGPEERQS